MMEYDGIKLCEKCGEYTTGRLCRSCAFQEMIDSSPEPDYPSESDIDKAEDDEREYWLQNVHHNRNGRGLGCDPDYEDCGDEGGR